MRTVLNEGKRYSDVDRGPTMKHQITNNDEGEMEASWDC